MMVTLVTNSQLHSLVLPEKIGGKYWISDTVQGKESVQVLSIEGLFGEWVLRASKHLMILENDEAVEQITLQKEIQVISLKYRSTGALAQLLIEPQTNDRQEYSKYHMNTPTRLNIGRAQGNQITIQNDFVSSVHACLVWDGATWTLTDLQSKNGTFVNEKRVATATLQWGDIIYIMGTKIVVGNSFFTMNNPDDSVSVQAQGVVPLVPQPIIKESLSDAEDHKALPFYRAPRVFRRVVKPEIRVDAPPTQQKIEPVSLALMLGPAMTMGMTAVVMAVIAWQGLAAGTTTIQSAVPTLTMCFSMLCASIVWPPLTRRHERKRKQEIEAQRRESYQRYLQQIRGLIYEKIALQAEILRENAPTLPSCAQRILQLDADLWCRNASHEDFLSLRLGLGELPLQANFRFPDNRFTVEDDDLVYDMKRLEDEPKQLKDVPIMLSLAQNTVSGVIGKAQQRESFIQGLLLQLVALHSWDEVKLVFIGAEQSMQQFPFAKWLPHTWDDAQEVHYMIANEMDGKTIGAVLEPILAERITANANGAKNTGEQYVVVVLDMALAEKMDLFQALCAAPKTVGFSTICVAEQLRDLPKECQQVVELNETKSTVYQCQDTTGHRDEFVAEYPTGQDMLQIAYTLANIQLKEHAEQYTLPNMLTFLDMYEVGKVEHLNARSRWQESNPVRTLQAMVGVGKMGEPFYLDLHEKFHGPHGLVAGMTGSGKSEFIITYILSMALNYHPDEVAFILIDYKGGGLAGAFEDTEGGVVLPHLAGTITNLEGASVKRSLISIQSELRRRQAIFNQARHLSGEGTVDIYKYQTMYRSGLVTEPVPHLVIVSDEFAELKAQQPEFMQQLISAARIGRSLGVHLVLATQKPAGVVDDQIWSNSRFRICLKVQERADSMDMIKRPDAAELAQTGRFYLQVGFNELFEFGQSAWCGAPYQPMNLVDEKQDLRIMVKDAVGQVLAEAQPKPVVSATAKTSQTVEVVKYLSAIAQEENIRTRQLWLPTIPGEILLSDLRKKYEIKKEPYDLSCLIGEYDDPFHQTQNPLTLSFTQGGNTLLYGMVGSGKAMMLETILCGLIEEYSAEQLHLYLLDMGEETLVAFEHVPQVGDVVLASQFEKVENFFKMLHTEIARRKKQFAQNGGNYLTYCQQTGKEVPQILVVIRNYSAFAQQYEQIENELANLTREASKYGIYFLMTADNANEVRFRLGRTFTQFLTLQLHDRGDYIALFGNTDGVYPSKQKGRGLVNRGGVYEFQTAQFSQDEGFGVVQEYCKLHGKKGSVTAPAVPILPDEVTTAFFADAVSLQAFPVGVEKESLRFGCMDFTRSVMQVVYAESVDATLDVTRAMLMQLTTCTTEPITVWDPYDKLEPVPGTAHYINGFEQQIETLFAEIVCRHNTTVDAREEGKEAPTFAPMTYCVLGISSILASLPANRKDELETLLEKTIRAYGLRVILCEAASALIPCARAAWYKKQISGRDGLWVGNGIADQSTLKTNYNMNGRAGQIGAQFGYIVQQGEPTLVKLLTTDQSEEG